MRATWQRYTPRPLCMHLLLLSLLRRRMCAIIKPKMCAVIAPARQHCPNEAGVDVYQVERFDAREGHWSEVAPMAQKRGAHACTTANGHLVAIGGWDGVK
jgi:hypothetical protein